MERRKFGNTGMEFSVLGFGGAEIGYNESQTQDEVDLLLNTALDSGLNVIDTAAAYKTSEELIGKAVGHRRNDYYLLTKCGALDAFTRSDWSSDGIVNTIETSLRNLKTDHIDIVQLHSCDSEELRRGDAIEGLERAREKDTHGSSGTQAIATMLAPRSSSGPSIRCRLRFPSPTKRRSMGTSR